MSDTVEKIRFKSSGSSSMALTRDSYYWKARILSLADNEANTVVAAVGDVGIGVNEQDGDVGW